MTPTKAHLERTLAWIRPNVTGDRLVAVVSRELGLSMNDCAKLFRAYLPDHPISQGRRKLYITNEMET